MTDLAALRDFLGCATPDAWLEVAPGRLDLLLVDHANCEKKAASAALSMLYRYEGRPRLVQTLSRLAREELRHFEQVERIIRARGIPWQSLSASRYAAGLRTLVRGPEPERLVDLLICGAFVEARSCERFAAVAPRLDPLLERFYLRLLASEARHFRVYLELAEEVAGTGEVAARVDRFRRVEAELILSPDPEFRFHSGVPAAPGPGADQGQVRRDTSRSSTSA